MHIVKRRGHKQEFDERKVYASVYAACLSCHMDKESAETIATVVVEKIKRWLTKKDEATSDDIFKQVSEELMSLDKEVAFMYTTHRDVS